MGKTTEDELTKMLDMMVRKKILEKLDTNIKYMTMAFDKADFKSCDIEKLEDLNNAFDGVRFALHKITEVEDGNDD